MNNKIYIISILSAFVFNVSFAQKGKVKSAQKQYDKLYYVKSTEILLKLVEDGNTSVEVIQNLANAYYFNGKMVDASKWYGELLSLNQESNPENYFRYAQSLRAQENYTEADKVMQKFSSISPDDSRSMAFVAAPDYLDIIDKLSYDFQIENLSINSGYSDFGASFYNSGIYFASSMGEGKIYNWNEQPYLDIYTKNEGEDVSKIAGNVNTKYHESSTTFSKDGTVMYFTRNNYFNGEFKKNNDGVHSLKVYRAELVDGEWTNVEPLPFNNDEYNIAHPALNNDETKLYFASDMPGTLGGSDIYVVSVNEDGSYGEPTNLGKKINTEGRENFPFVSDNGTLYFSSDAHIGLGGLDVFEFENIDAIITSSNVVYNVGKPINSPKDDFGYIINETTLKGYFSSNRDGGKGDDDIYSFTRNVCQRAISGTVVDKDTNQILSDATVIIYNENGNEVKRLVSDANGMFSTELNCETQNFTVIAAKDEYEQDQQGFSLHAKFREDVTLKLSLNLAPAAVGTNLNAYLNLNPIYFDFDKPNIRPDAEIELVKIIGYLKAFPSVKIDVKSHTDSRGNNLYNEKLSDRRKISTIDYIINNGGISRERLTGKGYGETKLVNRCSDGVSCSKDEFQANRRSEFIVIAN